MAIRVMTIVGARPQFIKAAVVSRAMASVGIVEMMIHTGQHYDASMSGIFFDELDIPRPVVDLEVGSGSHAVQTGVMMMRLEKYIADNSPFDWILVYGDTNSTLAGAMVAAKMNVPLAHVEAGLRSFNRRMPEEINRIVTDRLSQQLFCPTETAVLNLNREGIVDGVFFTGDVMLDATRLFAERSRSRAPLASITDFTSKNYYLATIHRAENTDNAGRLSGIFEGFGRLKHPVLVPIHPRTKARLAGLDISPNVFILEPASYLEMLTLIRNSRCVLTDSGGVQKEAYWLDVPCVTMRAETEWIETLDNGWNQLAGSDPDRIVEAVHRKPKGNADALGKNNTHDASSMIVACLLK